MTWEQGSEYVDIADEKRQNKQFAEAGDYYTQATCEYFGQRDLNLTGRQAPRVCTTLLWVLSAIDSPTDSIGVKTDVNRAY